MVSAFKGLTFDKERSESFGYHRADAFQYQRFEGRDIGPLAPQIKLEMGYRGVGKPNEKRPIQSYIGYELGKAGETRLADHILSFEIPIRDIGWTFVEKLFAAHSAFENKKVKKHYLL